MGGLRNICKIYGGMKVVGANGEEVIYEYDYKKDKPIKKAKKAPKKKEVTNKD